MGKKRQPPSDDKDDDEEEELNLEEFEESEEEEYDSDVRISSDFFFSFARRAYPHGRSECRAAKAAAIALSLFFLDCRPDARIPTRWTGEVGDVPGCWRGGSQTRRGWVSGGSDGVGEGRPLARVTMRSRA